MERPLSDHPFKESGRPTTRKGGDDTETLNEHVQKFIEELEKGHTPQDAVRHAEDFKNTRQNYFLEKKRHLDYWRHAT